MRLNLKYTPLARRPDGLSATAGALGALGDLAQDVGSTIASRRAEERQAKRAGEMEDYRNKVAAHNQSVQRGRLLRAQAAEARSKAQSATTFDQQDAWNNQADELERQAEVLEGSSMPSLPQPEKAFPWFSRGDGARPKAPTSPEAAAPSQPPAVRTLPAGPHITPGDIAPLDPGSDQLPRARQPPGGIVPLDPGSRILSPNAGQAESPRAPIAAPPPVAEAPDTPIEPEPLSREDKRVNAVMGSLRDYAAGLPHTDGRTEAMLSSVEQMVRGNVSSSSQMELMEQGRKMIDRAMSRPASQPRMGWGENMELEREAVRQQEKAGRTFSRTYTQNGGQKLAGLANDLEKDLNGVESAVASGNLNVDMLQALLNKAVTGGGPLRKDEIANVQGFLSDSLITQKINEFRRLIDKGVQPKQAEQILAFMRKNLEAVRSIEADRRSAAASVADRQFGSAGGMLTKGRGWPGYIDKSYRDFSRGLREGRIVPSDPEESQRGDEARSLSDEADEMGF